MTKKTNTRKLREYGILATGLQPNKPSKLWDKETEAKESYRKEVLKTLKRLREVNNDNKESDTV